LEGVADDEQLFIGELRNLRVWNSAFDDRQIKYYQRNCDIMNLIFALCCRLFLSQNNKM
jgi:hypothetical protein